MVWTFIFLFLAVVTAIIGFLGLGFGPIEPAKIAFYFVGVFFVISYFIERRKKPRHYLD
ncbi:MAG: DUF1328 domain-containing protein [Aequorivita sp.]